MTMRASKLDIRKLVVRRSGVMSKPLPRVRAGPQARAVHLFLSHENPAVLWKWATPVRDPHLNTI